MVCAIALCALAGGAIGLLTCGLAQLSALEPLLLLPLCLLSSCTLLLLEPLPLLPLPLCLLSCTLLTLLAAVSAGAAPRRASHRGAETHSLSMPVQAAVHGSRAVPRSHVCLPAPPRSRGSPRPRTATTTERSSRRCRVAVVAVERVVANLGGRACLFTLKRRIVTTIWKKCSRRRIRPGKRSESPWPGGLPSFSSFGPAVKRRRVRHERRHDSACT